MNTTMLIKIDKKLKEQAQRTAKELGLPLSTVTSGLLKEFVLKKEITFSLTPNKRLRRSILETEKSLKDKKNLSPAFKNKKEIIKWLED